MPRVMNPYNRNPPPPPPPVARRYLGFLPWAFLAFAVCVLLIMFIRYVPMSTSYPGFKVESVVVSFNNGSVAEWALKLSVRNPNKIYDFHYRGMEVFIQCMSQDWLLGANVGPFSQGSKNTTFVNAAVKTLPQLPVGGGTTRGMVWDLAVMFRARYTCQVEAFCRNMKVVFAPNATKGMLVEGPISCPLGMIKC